MNKLLLKNLRATLLLSGMLLLSMAPAHSAITVNTYSPLIWHACQYSSLTVSVNITVAPAEADDYFIEVASDAGFTTIVATGSLTTLNIGNGYTGNVSVTVDWTNVTSTPGNYHTRIRGVLGLNSPVFPPVILVSSKPSADFTIPMDTQCHTGNLFTPVLTTPLSNTAYGWYWNDGDIDTTGTTPPSHTYAMYSWHTVVLVAVDSTSLCSDTGYYVVMVDPQPVTSYTVNDNTQCLAGNSFAFTDGSSIPLGTITSYAWDFGDGGTSSSASPTHSYASAGGYSAKLVLTSAKGCKDSLTQSMTVYSMPVPSFTVNDNQQCLNPSNNFAFTNTTSGVGNTYLWNFKDGSTSAATSPSKTYASYGSYNVSLRVTDSNGCIDSTLQAVTVDPKPTPGFTVNIPAQCLNGNSFAFTNTSTIGSGTMSYAWDFGDGTTSNAVSPTKTYGLSGVYVVKLVATSNNGCADSTTTSVTVYASPAVNFTNPSPVCAKDVSFVNTSVISSGSIVSYLWNFGDVSAVSTLTHPNHEYPNVVASYNVTLVATSNFGCVDSVVKTVTTTTNVIADFTANQWSQCLGTNSFIFNNTSLYNHPAYVTSSKWTFGDGGLSYATFPNPYTYADSGTYDVTLVVYANTGCNDTIVKQVRVVKAVADFDVAAGSCTNTVTFANNTVVTVGTTSTYWWDFNDATNSTLFAPSKTYPSSGTYTVMLTVTTFEGCVHTATKSISVGIPPVAGFTHSSACNNLVSFTNTSLNGSTYLWSFGDAGTSTLQHPTHGYVGAGTYSVKLVTTNSNGCKDSITQNVTAGVFTPAPVAIISTSNLSCNSYLLSSASSTAAPSVQWFFYRPDNTLLGSVSGLYTTPQALGLTVPPAQDGYYTVRLIASGSPANTCFDTSEATLLFTAIPVASFTTSTNTCTNTITFTSTSTVNNGLLSYYWDFGDGNFSTLQNPTHNYSVTGVYPVTLTVTSESGCQHTVIQNVNATSGSYAPTAAYTYALASGSCTNKYQFTNTSSGGAVTYLWNFGDGTTSTLTNPTHAYAMAGTYMVTLTAYSVDLCNSSVSQTITVTSGQYGPAAAFTISDDDQCLSGNSFNFYNSSTYNGFGWIPYYYWDFGDGTYSYNTFIFNKTYATAGSYTVMLVAGAYDGCMDTVYHTVNVVSPNISFSLAGNACITSISFTNTTTAAGNPSMTYLWDFGDTTTSTLTNPSHVYAFGGSRDVTLTATTAQGCVNSATQNIYIGNNVTAGFSTYTFCDYTIGFTNTSANAATYTWDFGDASTSTQTHPSHGYVSNGTYNVKLVATSIYGCKDSITQSVSASAQGLMPDANINYNTLSCNIVSLHANTSVNTDSVSWFAYNASNTLALSVNKISKNDSVGLNPTGVYGYGLYTIKLVAYSNSSNCTDTAVVTINFSAPPTASFTTSVNACTNAINFTNTSANGSTYLWNFGDASTSTSANPSHQYAIAGTYTVTLTVTSAAGCVAFTSSNVTAGVPLPGAVASFTYTTGSTLCVTNRARFTNTSSGATSYIWIFGDGKGASTTHAANTYALAGSYTVQLIAYNTCGSDTATALLSFGSPAAGPIALPGVEDYDQCVTGNMFNFPNYSYHTNPMKWIPFYFWDMGDATTNTNNHALNKTYALSGTYTVTLIATDVDGCKDTATQVVYVRPTPCSPLISYEAPKGDINQKVGGALDKPGTNGVGELNGDSRLSVYPNPNMGSFTLKMSDFINTEVQVTIVDLLGRKLVTKTANLRSNNELEMNASELHPGTYHVLVTDSDRGDVLARKAFIIVK